MPDHTNNGMQCHEFDGLVSDALDGVLTGAQLEGFHAHARTCSVCGPLFAEVTAGRNWLKDLTEVEPPVGLVTNILASTTGVDTQRLRVNVSSSMLQQPRVSFRPSWWERAQAWASGAIQPIWGTVRQPRFAMSFGMAFFSLSVALSVLGVKPADLRSVSLRPAAIRHTYYNTQARVVRYYDNIKLVYEVQAARARTQAQRRACRGRAGKERPQERHNTTARAEAGSQLQPEREPSHSGLRSAGSICKTICL